MSEPNYPFPVSELLKQGSCLGEPGWPDYLSLGLGPEHIPDLIRMATDEALNDADSESLEVWAPTHAWRALGQLRAEAAVEPLLGLLRRIEENDDDWVLEDLPRVYGMIGPAAIPALAAYLADASHELHARIATAGSLRNIGQNHPEARSQCIAVLTGQLEQFEENDPSVNGWLISELIDLAAVESAATMERAFAADCVDPTIAGDWEDVQVGLGLKTARETPRPRFHFVDTAPDYSDDFTMNPQEAAQRRRKAKRRAKARARRKQQKQSRPRHRKR
jgi:hypothetical protein